MEQGLTPKAGRGERHGEDGGQVGGPLSLKRSGAAMADRSSRPAAREGTEALSMLHLTEFSGRDL